MKSLYLLLILTILCCYKVSAQTDEVLKHSSGNQQIYFTDSTIKMQCARFEPKAPCHIKSISISLAGEIGTFRVRMFGYETADQVPDLQNDKFPPIKVQKTIKGNQTIVVTLPESVYFDNSWFWISIDSLSKGLFLLSDNVAKKIPYDIYYYQAIETTNPDPTKKWGVGPYAYFISCNVNYPLKVSPMYLKDITATCGIKKVVNDTEVPIILSSCISAGDYNADGYVDIFVNNKLYENNKNCTFTDVTDKLGLVNDYNKGFTKSTGQDQTFVDTDNDGDLDIVSFGPDTSVVFINDDGAYTKKILSFPPFLTFGYSQLLFNWADLNYDGYPDVFAGQQASEYGANGPDILPSYILMNKKDNDFFDESIRMFPKNHIFRRARAATFGDFNNDGHPDLYIGNYFLERDELYLNDGNGYFTDISPQKKLDLTKTGSQHGCGVSWCDYNNDGNLDVMVARIAHSRFVKQYDHRGSVLYRNEGPPNYNFTDLTGQYNDYPGQIAPCGLEYEDYHSSAAFADVNNDGLPDLLLKTYNPARYISFYEQQEDHTFKMKRFEYGLDKLDCYGAGQVWLDINNDGKLDLAMYNQNKISLYQNTIHNGNNSVELDLQCTSGNKFAIGARAYVHSQGKQFMRELTCGQDETVQFPNRLHFGLGDITDIDSIVVWWPTKPKKTDVYKNLKSNNIYALKEGGEVISTTPVGVRNAELVNFSLSAAPNPFENISVIAYTVVQYARVNLAVYNEAGTLVQTLVDSEQSPGEYTKDFNASALPSGSYFYRLTIDGKSQTEKLILMK
jgi:hypothetical protein